MESIYKDNYEFIKENCKNINIIFSTAKNNIDFNLKNKKGKENILKLKEWFDLEDVGYLNQIHSNIVHDYNNEVREGDGIITDKKNVAVGVFTADCVPVLLYDKDKEIIAAVHSGWRGTFSGIVINTIGKMQKLYGCKGENIYAYIGPHNKVCCYEVGEDLIKKFKECSIYDEVNISDGNKLNLECCIIKQLEHKKVPRENISISDFCTFCNEQYDFYSYRKQKEQCGRMFSFIYMK